MARPPFWKMLIWDVVGFDPFYAVAVYAFVRGASPLHPRPGGAPGLATYAATKAFPAVWAESLWVELRGDGVDALACVAGGRGLGSAAAADRADAP